MDSRFLSWAGGLATAIATCVSFALFYYDTGQFGKSLAAALMTGALVFGTYMVLRWLIQSTKS